MRVDRDRVHATTTAVAGLLQFKQFASDLSLNPAIKHANVTIANPGNPQTLLLIGSDHRAGEPFSASNTDTMMLVRLDPNSSTINVLSIPRDLKVQIPQGERLPLRSSTRPTRRWPQPAGPKSSRQQVFPGLQVNHIIDVNFKGFSDLVDAIGCVYTDVDHRYYNNTAVTDYSSIDIQPGYQKLCGDNQSSSGALAFVRFRHTDTDIVRNARQQDFLRWAKSQFSGSTLLASRDRLLRIFGGNSQTDPDLHTTDGLINLFNLVAFSAGHSVKQIPFPAIIPPCTPTLVLRARQPGSPSTARSTSSWRPTITAAAPSCGGGAEARPASRRPRPPRTCSPTSTGGKAQAAALGNVGLPGVLPAAARDRFGVLLGCDRQLSGRGPRRPAPTRART